MKTVQNSTNEIRTKGDFIIRREVGLILEWEKWHNPALLQNTCHVDQLHGVIIRVALLFFENLT